MLKKSIGSKMIAKGFLIDLDGVLVDGGFNPLEGAVEFIKFLKERNIPFQIATSNSQYPPEELAKKLAEKGFPVDENDILSPLSIAPIYLKEEDIKKIYVIGSDKLKDFLKEKDFSVEENEFVDAVLVGLDKNLSFEKLKIATTALKKNKAKLYALNGNIISQDKDGRLFPGVGSIAKMLSYTCSCNQEFPYFGKVSDVYNLVAFKKLGLKPEEIAIISDDLFVDIKGYKKLGLTGIFMTTGKYSREDINSENQPDYTFNSLKELLKILEGKNDK